MTSRSDAGRRTGRGEARQTPAGNGAPARTPAPRHDGTPAGPSAAPAGVPRRTLLGVAGAAGLTVGAAAGAGGHALAAEQPRALSTVGSASVPFHGRHQAGISSPLQAHGHLVAFDLVPGAGRDRAAALMRRWTSAAATMAEGRQPAEDNQIALDAGPSSLTVTFGFGASFFDRTGLRSQRPEALAPLPPFSADALDRQRSDGDLFVQVGADDALVAFHALRVLQKLAAGTAAVRWQMSGFNRTPGATAEPRTARNLMGQVDGTNNPRPSDADFDARVFVPASARPAWMANGSYVVVRRIRMLLDSWDQLSLAEQEKVIGRRKSDGAPLSGGTETTPVDLGGRRADGSLAIAGDAHVRVAAPESNGGAAMLRRPFSFHDGFDERGAPDAGLLFMAWQADPRRGFVPVQRKLDRGDGLSRFLRHEASALFAVPGGCAPGEYVGQRLLQG
ncbi:iron uptake transporter deferrochelatase/peroxidase subunit [Wenjunlia vitaminophila]|uniref:iron uptake transporter deferrochelatase/peroxidase subunit n=1 Tax=Wenjunlia vitaminophila TaxID=76728 RepID=UPI0003A15AF1|nr:iron uptake transporter deferrochelatase/peroxidase subunit [Wenjunlia vitaminophila]